MRLAAFLNFLAIFIILVSACTSPSPIPTPTFTFEPVETQIEEPTTTPQPSPTPSPSVIPTITLTLTPTASPTITPDAALSQVELIGLAWYENYDLMLSFQFPGPVDPVNYRVTLEEKEFRCETLSDKKDRLYCRGQGAKVLAEATVRVYPVGSLEPGFEKKVWIPYFDNNYNSYNN